MWPYVNQIRRNAVCTALSGGVPCLSYHLPGRTAVAPGLSPGAQGLCLRRILPALPGTASPPPPPPSLPWGSVVCPGVRQLCSAVSHRLTLSMNRDRKAAFYLSVYVPNRFFFLSHFFFLLEFGNSSGLLNDSPGRQAGVQGALWTRRSPSPPCDCVWEAGPLRVTRSYERGAGQTGLVTSEDQTAAGTARGRAALARGEQVAVCGRGKGASPDTERPEP